MYAGRNPPVEAGAGGDRCRMVSPRGGGEVRGKNAGLGGGGGGGGGGEGEFCSRQSTGIWIEEYVYDKADERT